MNERETAEMNAKIHRLSDTIAQQQAQIDRLTGQVTASQQPGLPVRSLDPTQSMTFLENLKDRACQGDLPMGLTDFVDWLRGLYPELYSSRKHPTAK